MMYILGILCTLLLATSAEHCYDEVDAACSSRPVTSDGPLLEKCSAKYGGFEGLLPDLQAYANGHIETSFEFLLMSTHFGNYESNREGFKNLYRKLSDQAWEDAIDVIKYIATRGGNMNFNQLPHFKKNVNNKDKVLQLNELNSLAKALDTEKQLANEALRLHSGHDTKKDAATAHYIEEKFFESQSDSIRKLAGYTSDLKKLLSGRDPSLSLFLFDEYLKKTL